MFIFMQLRKIFLSTKEISKKEFKLNIENQNNKKNLDFRNCQKKSCKSCGNINRND